MIVIRLKGGLGNQLFQYAAGRALALKHRVDLAIDLRYFASDRFGRNYRLNHFNVSAIVLTDEEAHHLWKRYVPERRENIIKYIKLRVLPFWLKPTVIERHYHYDPLFKRIGKEAFIDGYWQSYRYFEEYEDTIRSELTIRSALSSKTLDVLRRIENTQSVSIHIRRGDYLSNDLYAICESDYYLAALSFIMKNIQKPQLFFFSDDMPWVRRNFNMQDANYVDHNDKAHDVEDLFLMSHCRHHIIANSTFSWWGAWLCPHPNKIVVAPKKWFTNNNMNTDDLIPRSWLRL